MVQINQTDEFYMARALKLAQKALGRTNPNPMVGCVLVKENHIVGEGYHHAAGQPHAEVMALRDAGEAAAGSTAYVSLEPCSHYGRTPPCADALIQAKVSRVVAAMQDPDPRVAGRGFEKLREAGIEVYYGVLEDQAKELNEVFIKYATTRLPFVLLKSAMSLDGKIATRTGDSKWITGERARKQVHRLRDRYQAILVGIGTVLKDNPSLTTRLRGGRDPIRVIIDGLAETPPTARVIQSDSPAPVIIAVTDDAPEDKIMTLRQAGAEVVRFPGQNRRVEMNALMEHLGRHEIDSVLIEGGGKISAAALNAGIVDKVLFFYAPKIFGGSDAVTAVEGPGMSLAQDALKLERTRIFRYGDDFAIQGYLTDRRAFR